MSSDSDSSSAGSVADSAQRALATQEAGDDDPPQPLLLTVAARTPKWAWAPDETVLRNVAGAITKTLDDNVSGEAAIVLSDDIHVGQLNLAHRGQAAPTNVLSYPAAEPGLGCDDGDKDYLGDVILANETIGREAAEAGICLRHHTIHLIVHGVLHLLGFTHDDDTNAQIMERAEIAILAQLGIPDPYAGSALQSSWSLLETDPAPVVRTDGQS